MNPAAIYRVANALCLALYTAGLAAVSTFIANTRVVGVRDGRIKLPAIVACVAGLPTAGLLHVLASGGAGAFMASLLRPASLHWAWRTAFTFLGGRYIGQEINSLRNPRPAPPEVVSSSTYDVDMREDIAKSLGIKPDGIRGRAFRANELYCLQVSTYEVRLPRLPRQFDGYTIAQVSDIHYGDFLSAEFVRRYVQLTIDLSPDLVALTGDYQQYPRDVWRAAGLLAPFGEWSRKERGGLGAIGIMGNHDTAAGTAEVTEAIKSAGIKVMHNSHVKVAREDTILYVAGVADPWSLRADLSRALLGVPGEACVVLLAHEPDYLVKSAESGVDLQLSGHLHGGQIKLPLVGPSRYNRRYIEGFYKRNNTLMFVSRGLGGHPPVRYKCKPEIALLKLRSA